MADAVGAGGLAAYVRRVRGLARAGALGVHPRRTASVDHTIIKTNVGAELRGALAARGCTVMVDGAQILTEEISAVPDVVVTCSPIDHSTPVIALPVIIVEVISPSSALNDTGLRWLAYRNVPSLKHYLVLSQDLRLVHVHSRAGHIWRERFLSAGVLEVDQPPVRLDIDALYAATDLAA